MAFLTRDQILGADDRKTREVEVIEWGGTVLIRTLSGKERDKFEASLQVTRGTKTKQNFENFRARLIALCIVNDSGERLFADSDVVLLGDKSVAALQRVFNACNEMNGLSDEDVDELTKDFEEEGQEDSTSD